MPVETPQHPIDLIVNCGRCGQPLTIPEFRLPSDRIGEQWDEVEPLLPARGWASALNEAGGRMACCPACAREHYARQTFATLPQFDPRGKCPKCRHNRIKTAHCPGRTTRCPLMRPHEHLHRTCDRCGYLWGEATADAKAEPTTDEDPEPCPAKSTPST